jgi:hypothetical protein
MSALLKEPQVMEAIGWLLMFFCPLKYGEITYQPYLHECLLGVAKKQQWVSPNVTQLAPRKPFQTETKYPRSPLLAIRNIRARAAWAPKLEALAPFAHIKHEDAVRLHNQAKSYREYCLQQLLAYRKWRIQVESSLPPWAGWLLNQGSVALAKATGKARSTEGAWYVLAVALDPQERYYVRRAHLGKLKYSIGENQFRQGIMPYPRQLQKVSPAPEVR